MNTHIITTPIYYANGTPHLGHAYTTIAADAVARYHRLCGHRVRFHTGTDEHGLKVLRAAQAAGVSPREHVDAHAEAFSRLFASLHIAPDRFVRTTHPDHIRFAQSLESRLEAAGDIYPGHYEGWYAEADEAFYTDAEVHKGRALATDAPVRWVREPTLYFRLSRYQDALLELYRDRPELLQPAERRLEIVRFIEDGLRDISISRSTFDWGVPILEHPGHIQYVWLDALASYISALDSDAHLYPHTTHLIGKDITRFHGVYWPAFLLSAGLPLPRRIFAHGWWLSGASKLGKRTGAAHPGSLIELHGADALRFFLLRDVTFGRDGTFAIERFHERYRAELASQIGNLAQRVLALCDRCRPAPRVDVGGDALKAVLRQLLEAYRQAFRELALHTAATSILEVARTINRFVQDAEPWHSVKERAEHAESVLFVALEALGLLSRLLEPLTPVAADALRTRLGLHDEVGWARYDEPLWRSLDAKASPGPALFPR